MKKYLALFMLALIFCAAISAGCGGGGSDNDSAATEQTENVNNNTGGDDNTHSDFEDGRGGGGKIIVNIHNQSTNANDNIKSIAFYTRKKGGKWEKLVDAARSDGRLRGFQSYLKVSKEYVEFGFEFNLLKACSWPYSGVFWTEGQSRQTEVNDISITFTGSVFDISLYIAVNGKEVINKSSCSSHTQFTWDYDALTRVIIDDSGAFKTKSRAFYARMSGGSWVRLKTKGEDERFTITNDYDEYGFEFDITWGTDWPYSNVFWTEAQSRNTKAQTIDINIGGGVRTASIKIVVNGNEVVDETNCSRHDQYPWGI